MHGRSCSPTSTTVGPPICGRSGCVGAGGSDRRFFFEPVVEPIEPTPDGTEFRDWAWMKPTKLIDRVVDFRKQPYRQVLIDG